MLGIIWFILIGVLIAGYMVTDGFDLGAGILYPFIAKSEEDKTVILRIIGPIWDGNEVWLLTAGGALFAAFPEAYATVFSGFYLALMLVLFMLIIRAGSLQFRSMEEGWKGFWDTAFFVSSSVAALLFGVAAGNIIRGVPLDNMAEYAGNFFTLLNPFSLLVGILSFAWFVMHGAAWIAKKSTGDLYTRAAKVRSTSQIVVLVLTVVVLAASTLLAPAAFASGASKIATYIFAVIAVGGVLVSYFTGKQACKKDSKPHCDLVSFFGSLVSGIGYVGIWASIIFPNLVPTPSYDSLSLTIEKAASADPTLMAMLVIAAIGVPLVLFYVGLIYKTYSGRVKASDFSDGHY